MLSSEGFRPYEKSWKEACQKHKRKGTNVLDYSLEIDILQAILNFLTYFTSTFERIRNLPDPNTKEEKDLIEEVYRELDAFWNHLDIILREIKGWDKNRWSPIWKALSAIKNSPEVTGVLGKARRLLGIVQQGPLSSNDNTELFALRNNLLDLAHDLQDLIKLLRDTIQDWLS